MKEKCRVAVLVSGNGSNLQAILDAASNPSYPAEVKLVISNVAKAYALERAQTHKVPTAVVSHSSFPTRPAFEEELIAQLDRARIELVVLAGFMRILSPRFVQHYSRRILNIHPSLLPAFPGAHALEDAWSHGAKVTGVTIHFVDEGTDTGPIIFQEAVLVDPKETLETLEKKVHAVEHRLYPEAIRLFAEGRLTIHKRTVFIGERRSS